MRIAEARRLVDLLTTEVELLSDDTRLDGLIGDCPGRPKPLSKMRLADWTGYVEDLQTHVAELKEIVKGLEGERIPKPRVAGDKKKRAAAKKGKAKKKGGPKKALNAYNFFIKHNRARVVSEQPDLTPKEVMPALVAEWKELDKEQKSVYQEKAKADKLRYQEQLAQYEAEKPVSSDSDSELSEIEEVKKKPKAKKRPRDPNQPKKYLSAYFLFQGEVRPQLKAQYPDTPFAEIRTMLSERWQSMTVEDKKKYFDAQNIAKAEWEEKMREYKANKPESNAEAPAPKKRKVTKKKKQPEPVVQSDSDSDDSDDSVSDFSEDEPAAQSLSASASASVSASEGEKEGENISDSDSDEWVSDAEGGDDY